MERAYPKLHLRSNCLERRKLQFAINHIKNDSDKLHSYSPELIAKLEEVLGIEVWPKFPWQ